MNREHRRACCATVRRAGILALSLALGACGQSGPLYLPKPPAEPPQRTTNKPAGDTQPVRGN